MIDRAAKALADFENPISSFHDEFRKEKELTSHQIGKYQSRTCPKGKYLPRRRRPACAIGGSDRATQQVSQMHFLSSAWRNTMIKKCTIKYRFNVTE